MRQKFKTQANQTNAMEAVAACCVGQPESGAVQIHINPGLGVDDSGTAAMALEQAGFKNADLLSPSARLLHNFRTRRHWPESPESDAMISNKVCRINLDIEIVTGNLSHSQGSCFQ